MLTTTSSGKEIFPLHAPPPVTIRISWKKRLFRLLAIVTVTTLVVAAALLWKMAGDFVSPPRTAFPAHLKTSIDNPEILGLLISHHRFDDGQVPTLIVQPSTVAPPSLKGITLRDQVTKPLLPYGETHSILVLLHGRTGRKEHLIPIAQRYCAAGFICVIPDLPSHGDSPIDQNHFGSESSEKGLPGRVADQAAALLQITTYPQSLWGMSMGGSFAIQSAAHEPDRWNRMVLLCTFDDLSGVISDRLQLPLAATLAGRFIRTRSGPDISKVNSSSLATRITVPTMVVHGTADTLISEARGKALHAALAGEKAYMPVPGATHNTILITSSPVYAKTTAWLLN